MQNMLDIFCRFLYLVFNEARRTKMATYTERELGWVSWDIETEPVITEEGDEVDGDTYALIAKVWTNPVNRGQGIARRNMLAAIEEIRAAHGSISIRLACEAQDKDTDTEKLAAFYESLGFEATGNNNEMELR
jgi:GNAT superfamily N-acetyltransferase